jgi:hypothetical protein
MKEAFNAVACVGIGALAVICLCFGPMPALGRAPGNFNNPPKVTAWFNSATSKISRCCDESDGFREGVAYPWSDDQPTVIFEEWAAQGDENHPYKVRILGKWVDVPGGGTADPRQRAWPQSNRDCNRLALVAQRRAANPMLRSGR